jgi:hypothetical protein
MADSPAPPDVVGDLLWKAWTALGVSAWGTSNVRAVIDPEVLIVLTTLLGDERLLHETIDWGILHAHLISPTRVRHVAQSAGVVDDASAWLATVAAHATSVRWRTDRALALEGFEPTGRSRGYSDAVSDEAATSALRARALAGATTRIEAIRSFHAVLHGVESSLNAAQVAARAATSTPGVFPILRELEQAGFLSQVGTPRRRRYVPRSDHLLARNLWDSWKLLPYAPWHEASTVIPVLARLRRQLATPDTRDAVAIATAVATLNDARASIAAIVGDAAQTAPRGSTADVARGLGALVEDALSRIVEQLLNGVDRPGDRDSSAARVSASAGSPWQRISWT